MEGSVLFTGHLSGPCDEFELVLVSFWWYRMPVAGKTPLSITSDKTTGNLTDVKGIPTLQISSPESTFL